jgi:uncharacterized protein YkwD
VGVATLAAGLGVTPSALAGSCSSHASWGTTVPSFERQVITLVNQHRRAKGLRPVRRSSTLTKAARWKSRHMARYRYFDHADPSGRSPFQRMWDCGFHRRLALGEPKRVRNGAPLEHAPPDAAAHSG